MLQICTECALQKRLFQDRSSKKDLKPSSAAARTVFIVDSLAACTYMVAEISNHVTPGRLPLVPAASSNVWVSGPVVHAMQQIKA